MEYVLARSRRLARAGLTFLIIRLTAMVMVPATNWVGYWVIHKESLIVLTVINTGLTTASEMGSRILVPRIRGVQNDGFIVTAADGSHHVHRQSVVNIVMTFLASVLGGPVYFIVSRRHRFLFFISFGIFNSFLSQGISSLLLDKAILIYSLRIYFDFIYNATVKFFMFEYLRPYLLRHKAEVKMMFIFRLTQDFLTTCIRVVILGLLNLKGY